jgi:hypothetical protein
VINMMSQRLTPSPQSEMALTHVWRRYPFHVPRLE